MWMNFILLAAQFVILCTLVACQSDVEWIAHRGASFDAPENTLASVNLAWDRGADAVEIDVFLSADGKIVAIHDDTTKRTAGLDRKVADQTLAELKRLDAGSWKDDRWAGERIPALEDILETIPDGKRLFVEIKCGKEILPVLEETLSETGLPSEKAVIISFDWEVVKAAREQMPEHQVYWVSGIKKDEKTGLWKPSLEELMERALAARLHGLDVQARAVVDHAFVEAVNAAGLKCFVWTVNDPAEAKRLIEAGVDGITTDRPKWMKQEVDRLSRTP